MAGMSEKNVSIDEVAKDLGRELFFGKSGRIEHVVGVSLRRRDPNVTQLNLIVDVDTDEVESLKNVISSIPSEWRGEKVYLRIGSTPRFA